PSSRSLFAGGWRNTARRDSRLAAARRQPVFYAQSIEFPEPGPFLFAKLEMQVVLKIRERQLGRHANKRAFALCDLFEMPDATIAGYAQHGSKLARIGAGACDPHCEYKRQTGPLRPALAKVPDFDKAGAGR